MAAIVYQGTVRIPDIQDLEAFRRWARSEQFPEQGRYAFIAGDIWMDTSMEQIFTHGQVVAEFSEILRHLVKANQLGYFLGDRTRLTNKEADLCNEPDGLFVSKEAIRSGRVYYEESEDGPLEIVGNPDMVLEVVSNSSVRKDTVTLRKAYWLAEIAEYWLIDARGPVPRFDLLKRGPRGYVATRPKEGWLTSKVFGQSFRLTRGTDDLGQPEFQLASRS